MILEAVDAVNISALTPFMSNAILSVLRGKYNISVTALFNSLPIRLIE